jgi:glutamine cyclotransferase
MRSRQLVTPFVSWSRRALPTVVVLGLAFGGCTGERPVLSTSTSEVRPALAGSTTTVSSTLVAGPAAVVRPRVLATYPHDEAAFTQGLEMSDGNLLEGTGLEGRSDLRLVELASGEVLRDVDLPTDVFGEGVTVLAGELFQLTYRNGFAFVRDPSTFEERSRFDYAGEGWGLTNDGQWLIMSDGTATLTIRDPSTFDVVRSVEVTDDRQPVNLLNELEYVNGLVYANVWRTDQIAVIDMETGRVIRWLDLAGLLTDEQRAQTDVLNGVAYRAETGTLLVTGKFWPTVFEIQI